MDLDSYNENKNVGTPIPMVFDFAVDLIEIEMEDKPELAKAN